MYKIGYDEKTEVVFYPGFAYLYTYRQEIGKEDAEMPIIQILQGF